MPPQCRAGLDCVALCFPGLCLAVLNKETVLRATKGANIHARAHASLQVLMLNEY